LVQSLLLVLREFCALKCTTCVIKFDALITENRPAAWKLDLELTEMYSQKVKPSAHLQSEVKCCGDTIRSSYFMPEQKPSKVVSLDSDDDFDCQSTPKPSTHSLLQQIENSPTKMAGDRGSISNNPFAKKCNIPPSPILNRYCLDKVKPESLFPSPIKTQDDSLKSEEPSQCESGPLVADSDEGTFRDSLFSQSSYLADESPQECDISASRPNLSR
jgi:hypothetical protein